MVHVYAKASGDITAVNVKAGDTVTKGQVLFTIDTEQVDTAKNSRGFCGGQSPEAQSDLARMQILYDGGDLSDQEYEQYYKCGEDRAAPVEFRKDRLRPAGRVTAVTP